MKIINLGRLRTFVMLAAVGSMFLSVACGGGSNNPTLNAASGSTALTFNIGDAPLNNGILAFEVTVNSVSLTGSSGTVKVLTSPVEIELSHLAGTFKPFALINVPTGSYTQLTADLGAAEVVFLPQGSSTPVHKNIPAIGTITVPLVPSISVSGNAATFNLDVDLAGSVTIDANNNVVFNPKFAITSNPVARPGEREDDENGELDDVKGLVDSVGTSSFVLKFGTTSNPHSFTFNVDGNTVFDGISGLSALKTGMLVQVDAAAQSDGSFLAKKVELDSDQTMGIEAEGLVFSSANMPSSFQLVAHETMGANAPNLGSTITVNLLPSSGTRFRAVAEGNLTIPAGLTFTAATLAAGQAVEADADGGTGATMTAGRVQLKSQAVDGTIAGLNGTNFQLTLNPNSTLAKLSGQTSINVVAANVENKTGASLANGQVVRVRGLLFFTPAAGSTPAVYTMVARAVKRP